MSPTTAAQRGHPAPRADARASERLRTLDVLTVAACVVELHGFVATARAAVGDEVASVERVLRLISGQDARTPTAVALRDRRSTWQGVAEQVQRWASELDAQSERFYANVHAVAGRPWIDAGARAELATLVAGVAAHRRDVRRAALRRRQLRPGSYVGEIGERCVFDAHVLQRQEVDGKYGPSVLFNFLDGDGRTYKLTTRARLEAVERAALDGSVVRLRATVSDHREYAGVFMTVINRASVVTEADRPADGDAGVAAVPAES